MNRLFQAFANDRPTSRMLFGLFLCGAAILPFLAAIRLLIGGLMIAAAVSASEARELGATGRPSSYSSLKFDPWQDGAGSLSSSDIVQLPPESVITRHRVGRDTKLLMSFTYYEATYTSPNGETCTAHASGPLPMIAVRARILYGGVFLLATLGIVLSVIGIRLLHFDDEVPATASEDVSV